MQTFFKSTLSHPHFTWAAARDYALIALGCLLQAMAIRLFLVPAHLVSSVEG